MLESQYLYGQSVAMNDSTSIQQFDHFIPASTSSLIHKLQESGLSEQQLTVIHQLKQILSFQFYQKLVQLKKLYQPFNPDRELIPEDASTDAETCINALKQVLIAANYTELNREQIEYALQKTSPYGLEIHIDFDHFENVLLFYRGKSQSSIEVRDWKKLYLKKKTVTLINYQRLFLLLRYKNQQHKPGIHLKLFRDILRPDLEMLFPESKIRMKLFDKIKLGVTGGGGTVGGLFATIGKITAAINPWTIVIAAVGFAMLIWRQVSKVFIQRTRYMATLAQNLYFHNLDNNAGAISYLIDLARQEEIKESILAYALINLKSVDNSEQLDSACEHWFNEQYDRMIDFDVKDALEKLQRLGLLNPAQKKLSCRTPAEIIPELNLLWNSYIVAEKR